MDTKRFLIGTIVGAVTLYLVAILIFDWAFDSFYASTAGTATGVDREGRIFWAMIVANLAYGALLMYVLGNRAGALSVLDGARIGAITGFLLWVVPDFVFYGVTNIMQLAQAIVDPILEAVHGGIAGAVIVAVLKKIPASVSTKVTTTAAS